MLASSHPSLVNCSLHDISDSIIIMFVLLYKFSLDQYYFNENGEAHVDGSDSLNSGFNFKVVSSYWC
jgi:hypothetical protein